MALALGGLRAMHPTVHGMVNTRYEIMRMSCQSWSSVEVMYVQPPHVRVRTRPATAMAFGRVRPGLAVSRYHSPTRANLGPGGGVSRVSSSGPHGNGWAEYEGGARAYLT